MFNMKKCEKYNMKQAFEEKRDFDFTVSYVLTSVVAGRKGGRRKGRRGTVADPCIPALFQIKNATKIALKEKNP